MVNSFYTEIEMNDTFLIYGGRVPLTLLFAISKALEWLTETNFFFRQKETLFSEPVILVNLAFIRLVS